MVERDGGLRLAVFVCVTAGDGAGLLWWRSPEGAEAGSELLSVVEVPRMGFQLAEPMGVSGGREGAAGGVDCRVDWGCLRGGMWPIARNVCGSKKDTDFSLRPVGRRVWKFFWEVLCQAKVIRQRPLPGLAHAFVFWGFLAFALVTTNHVAVGFGHGFLQYAGGFGTFYVVFAAVWALLVAVGISGPVCAAVFGAAAVVGREGLDGVGRDCGAHLCADGELILRSCLWPMEALRRRGCGGRTRWCCWRFCRSFRGRSICIWC